MNECDLEYPTFYREKKRKARVPHQCSECHHTIKPSTEYIAISGKWDGKIDTYKQCLSCKEISQHYRDTENCCVALGGLFEAIANADRENIN